MRSLSLAEEVLSLASAQLKAGCPHSKRTGIVSPQGIRSPDSSQGSEGLSRAFVLGTSLEVQWLRLWASNAGDVGLTPGQRTVSHMPLSTARTFFF